jgi:hypothetical protein
VAQTETFRVKGYRDLMRGLKEADRGTRLGVRKAFRESGEIVKTDAAARMAAVDTRTAAGYKVGVTQKGVRVYQSVHKVTGKHPEYGRYQMIHALRPAQRAHQADTEHAIEHALDVVCDRFNHGGATP